MALTYTPAGSLGSPLPRFRLPTVEGTIMTSEALAEGAKAIVVLFICNHCPYVQAIEDRLIQLAHTFMPKGVRVVGICSNDPTDHPEDRPEELLQRWREKAYGFPYLVDQEQDVAKAFAAVCTPDIFVFDHNRKLCYRGRLDDSWRDPKKVQNQELKSAIEALLAGRSPAPQQNPSMGCSIKWKQG